MLSGNRSEAMGNVFVTIPPGLSLERPSAFHVAFYNRRRSRRGGMWRERHRWFAPARSADHEHL